MKYFWLGGLNSISVVGQSRNVCLCGSALLRAMEHSTNHTHSPSKTVHGLTTESFHSQAPSDCALRTFLNYTIHYCWYSVGFRKVEQEAELLVIFLLCFGSDLWPQVGAADACS